MDGYEVCTALKNFPETASIPIIFITSKNDTIDKTRAFDVGAVDYITKPFHSAEVKARVKTHLAHAGLQKQLKSQNETLENSVKQKTFEIKEMLQGSIYGMALMAEIRDPYTAGHQQRVSLLACTIAEKMGLAKSIIDGIRIAGILHDIGKIRVPVSILNRTGYLLDAEKAVIKVHPQVGYEILKNIPFPWPCAEIVYQHHERLDGSGYPLGLQGDDILLESRILSVADVTEATSSFRPYRPAQGIATALREISKKRGKEFDKEVVDACLAVFQDSSLQFEKMVDVSPLFSTFPQ
jgi:putative two-component system response regulator